MDRLALLRRGFLAALLLTCHAVHASDLMDNGDLADGSLNLASPAGAAWQLPDMQVARVLQTGSDNLADVSQTGTAQLANIVQQGSDQQAFILQQGENQIATILQIGQGNLADISRMLGVSFLSCDFFEL